MQSTLTATVSDASRKEQVQSSSLDHQDLSLLAQQLNLAIESAQAGTWVWDFVKNTRIVSAKTNFLMGLNDNDVKNPDIDLIRQSSIYFEDGKRVKDYFQHQVFESKETIYQIEYRTVWPDKSIHYLISRGHIFRALDGKPLKLIGMTWEITQIKKLEHDRLVAVEEARIQAEKRANEAEEYRRRQEEFASFICHEIRNPLNGIRGAVDWLETVHTELLAIPETSSQLTLLNNAKTIIKDCAELQQIVADDVLDFAKLQAGKVALHNVIFNPKQTIGNTLSIFSARLASKPISVILETNNVDTLIETDEFRFRQILINLVSNALKFTAKGRIQVAAKFELSSNAVMTADSKQSTAKVKHITCSVEDTGIGMDEKEVKHLFNPFQQANKGISSSYGGTGLGLVICKRLAELAGGTIVVESKKNTGSKFTFTFSYTQPLKPSLRPSGSLDSGSTHQTQLPEKKVESLLGAHVLIVDDSTINQRILARMLDKTGCTYQLASNGEEALKKNEEFKFSIIFMDVTMPVMDGLTATYHIRAREKKLGIPLVPIIGLSGNVSPEHLKKAMEIGMTGYLPKPYLKEDIQSMVYKHLQSSTAIDQKQAQQQKMPSISVVLPVANKQSLAEITAVKKNDDVKTVLRARLPIVAANADAKMAVSQSTLLQVKRNTCWFNCLTGIINCFVSMRDFNGFCQNINEADESISTNNSNAKRSKM